MRRKACHAKCNKIFARSAKSALVTDALAFERVRQHLDRMPRFAAGGMFDLMPATEAIGDDLMSLGQSRNRREKPAFSDFHGDIIMLFLVAERTGHTATAGVDFGYGASSRACECTLGRSRAKQSFEVTMTVIEHVAWL